MVGGRVVDDKGKGQGVALSPEAGLTLLLVMTAFILNNTNKGRLV